jgi:thiamine biosynthesis lipoprotein
LVSKKNILTSVIIILIFTFTVCSKAETSRTEFVLGTICSVTLFDQAEERIYKEIFSAIRKIDNLMSVNIPASDVSRINAAAGIEAVQVQEDVFKVIERAVFFANFSGGAFDPSVEPLVSLWGIGGENPRVPSQEEIDKVLPLINWQDIELDAENYSVFLKRKGMSLDLGAIAKGFAADKAAEIINNAGIERAIIDLGGNIIINGGKKDNSPWQVGIQNPKTKSRISMGTVRIPALPAYEVQSVVTSGIYSRFFEENNIQYHHIFSPSNGYPADNGLLSVTIISPNSMDADALSTAVFVLGYEKGKLLLTSFPGTEAVFIFKNLSVRTTPGVNFKLTDNSFYLD